MKKSFYYLIGIVLLLVTFCGCKKEEVTKVTKLEFTAGSYTISEREDMNMRKVLVFETQPAEAAESQKIVWSLSDESVAEMNGNFLTPKKAGSVIVTATVMGVSDQCEVVIEPIAITKITLSQTGEKNLFIGQSVITSIQVEPSDANVDNVGISYNANVVDVEKLENGDYKITAKSNGVTAFMASYNNVSAQFTVTSAVNEITKLELSKSNVLFVTAGTTTKLTPKITCTDNSVPPTYPELEWYLGNTTIAGCTIDQSGNLYTPSTGVVFVGVKYKHNEDVNSSALVTATEPEELTSLSIASESTTPAWGESFKVLVSSYSPEKADLTKLRWTCTPAADIVLDGTGVDADGKFYAQFRSEFKPGYTNRKVEIRANVGSVSATTNVTLTKQAPTSFTVSTSASSYRIPGGQSSVSFYANVEFKPEDLLDAENEFTFSAEKFTSKNNSSATTELEFGTAKRSGDIVYSLVTCKNSEGGLYKITAKSSDGRTSACNVTVLPDISRDNLRQWFVISDHIGCFINKEFTPMVSFKEGLYYGDDAIKVVSKKSQNETVCKPTTSGRFCFTLIDLGYIGTTEVEVKFRLLNESAVYTANCGVVNQCKSLVFKLANTSGGGTYEVEPVKIAGTANEYNLNGNGPAWLNVIEATLSDGSKIPTSAIEYSTAQTVKISGKEALVYNYKDGTSTRKSSYIWINGYDGNNSIKIYYKY